MTFREKLMQEHPDRTNDHYFGGCFGCPETFGYEELSVCPPPGIPKYDDCAACWDREMPEGDGEAGMVKPCPLCGAKLEAREYMKLYSDGEVRTAKIYVHESIGQRCALDGFELQADDVEYWNRRIKR